MTVVAGLAVEEVVVVAAALIPVTAPARVPELSGAPVVHRSGRDGLGFGDGGRSQTREAQTRAHDNC